MIREWLAKARQTTLSHADLIALHGRAIQALAVEQPNLTLRQSERCGAFLRQMLAHREQAAAGLASAEKLASGIAHSFNNLLAGIMGLAELMSGDQRLPPDVIADLRAIVRQGHRGASLIRQMLDACGESACCPREIHLDSLCRELISDWPDALPSNIHLCLKGDTQVALHVDPRQITDLVINLLRNAIEAMPNGGTIDIEVLHIQPGACSRTPADGTREWVRLTIQDTGCGMDHQMQRHLFEPFHTNKSPGLHAGMGLAQVKGIARQHGGHVFVQSHPGLGTSVSVYFPAPLDDSDREHDPLPLYSALTVSSLHAQ